MEGNVLDLAVGIVVGGAYLADNAKKGRRDGRSVTPRPLCSNEWNPASGR
jgi:hypothetical protein